MVRRDRYYLCNLINMSHLLMHEIAMPRSGDQDIMWLVLSFMFTLVQAQEFAKVLVPLFKQLAMCLNSSHFQVGFC